MIETSHRYPGAQKLRVGILGFGTVARAIAEGLLATGAAEIAFVAVRQIPLTDGKIGLPGSAFRRIDELRSFDDVDLVVETAVPSVFAELAPRILATTDFCGFSCTAMADPRTERTVLAAAKASGRRLCIPHGAVLGLDGIADGRPLIEEVTVTTTKSGKSLGLDPEISGVVFDGSAREACARFPRNVNVHAAVAMAGIGFDRTRSRVVAVPGHLENEHHIEVAGKGFNWDIKAASRSLGGVTGAYTPLSAMGSVQRILGGSGLVIV